LSHAFIISTHTHYIKCLPLILLTDIAEEEGAEVRHLRTSWPAADAPEPRVQHEQAAGYSRAVGQFAEETSS